MAVAKFPLIEHRFSGTFLKIFFQFIREVCEINRSIAHLPLVDTLLAFARYHNWITYCNIRNHHFWLCHKSIFLHGEISGIQVVASEV